MPLLYLHRIAGQSDIPVTSSAQVEPHRELPAALRGVAGIQHGILACQQFARDGKANAGAARACALATVKTLEQVRQVCRRKACPLIAQDNLGIQSVARADTVHGAACGGVFDAVFQQVQQRLHRPVGIGAQRHGRRFPDIQRHPGFGGQCFIASAYDKIRAMRAKLNAYEARTGRSIRLEVDGGIKTNNIAEVAKAGADTFVAGSAVFGMKSPEGYKEVISAMKAAVTAVR